MKRYANIRLLAAVALLVATAGCKDDEGPALKQPALLSIQDAAADAEVITVESPKKQTLNIRVEAEQISGNYITVVFKTDPELVETYNAAHVPRTSSAPRRPTHSRPPKSCCPATTRSPRR